MTPLPKRRHSTRRGGKRQAAIHLTHAAAAKCSNCGALVRPHTVCAACGYYQGKQVIVKHVKTGKKKS